MNSQLSVEPKQNFSVGFMNTGDFEHSQRVAKMFASSNLVPKDYQATIFDSKTGQFVRNEQALSNCVIALNMAARIGADPLMVMQNLVIVHNKPTWSSQFLIATFNTCGRFSNLKYEFFGEKGKDSYGCRAVATELSTGEKLIGTDVTIQIAKDEKWYDRSGSKWKTMPQQMLMYRAASWFIRANAPEISMGLHTQDEIIDVEPIDVTPVAENITEEKPAAKTRKSRSVDTLLGGQPVDEIKKETVVEVLEQQKSEVVASVQPVVAPTQVPQPDVRQQYEYQALVHQEQPVEVVATIDFAADMPTDLPPIGELAPEPVGTMQIPELAPEEPHKNGLVINSEIEQWKQKIDSWASLTDIANGLKEMPPKIKAELKPYCEQVQTKLKSDMAIIMSWKSREDFAKGEKEVDAVKLRDYIQQRQDICMQTYNDLW